jgi:hypothetical protein
MAKNDYVPAEGEIRDRAQQIWLERGGQPGHEIDNGLQAEYEPMQLSVRKPAELRPPKSEGDAKVSVASLAQVAALLRTKTRLHPNRQLVSPSPSGS